MDRKRRCMLTKLKTVLTMLEEELRGGACGGDGQNFRRDRTLGRERYRCPSMKSICPPRRNTLKTKAYPIVPCRENRLQPSYDMHACCPSTMILVKNQKRTGGICPVNVCSPAQRQRPGGSRQPLKLYIIQKDSSSQLCAGDYTPSRPRTYSYGCAPPKCTQSKELRGGIMHRGCASNKTNGLQDRCLRFCCITNPKCKSRPATSHLNRFPCNNRLPDYDFHQKPRRTGIHCCGPNHNASQASLVEDDYDPCIPCIPYMTCMPCMPNMEDNINPPRNHRSNSRKCHTYCLNNDYDMWEKQKPRCFIPVQTDIPTCCMPCCRERGNEAIQAPQIIYEPLDNSCCKTSRPSRTTNSSYCCGPSSRGTGNNVFKVPQVVLESSNQCYDYEPAKICLVYPVNDMENTCDSDVNW